MSDEILDTVEVALNVQEEDLSAHEGSLSAGEDIPIAQEEEPIQGEAREEAAPNAPEAPQDLISVFFNFVGNVLHSLWGE